MMKNLSMIVVYGKNSGVATTATFFGNQWWITAKDERLEWAAPWSVVRSTPRRC